MCPKPADKPHKDNVSLYQGQGQGSSPSPSLPNLMKTVIKTLAYQDHPHHLG